MSQLQTSNQSPEILHFGIFLSVLVVVAAASIFSNTKGVF
jgi:hypothetical protein